MRKIYILFLFTISFSYTNAQWQWQNPKPLGLNLQSVQAFDNNEMVATAVAHAVVRTNDGGSTWAYSYPLTGFHAYYDLSFSGTTGWLVGSGGAILKSTNKGQNWSDQSTVGFENWTSVVALTNSFAVSIGSNGKIARTTDGTNWSLMTVSGAVKNYNCVSFNGTDINNSKGIAVGAGGALAISTDGGLNWTVQANITTSDLNSVFYQSGTSNVWAVGYNGEIWKSTNDGASWTQLPSGTGSILYDIQIIGGRGYIAGAGRILRSVDNGDSWSNYYNDVDGSILFGISMTSLNTGWCVGQGGKVLLNTDGVSFNVVSKGYGPFKVFRGVDFSNLSNGVACGDGGLIKYSTDGGLNWNASTSGTTNDLSAVAFTDANTVCIAGDLGTILRSTDGGGTWSSVHTGGVFYGGLAFGSTNSGVAVGNNGAILKTTDGGATWTPKTSGVTNNLTAVSFSTAAKGFAVGSGSTILFTSDEGNTWTIKNNGVSAHLYAVHYLKNKSIAFAGGTGGILYRTLDDGDSWTPVPNAITATGGADITSIQAGDESNIAVATFTGQVFHTSDYGTTWTSENTSLSSTGISLWGLKAVDGSNLWTVGDRSTILKSQAGLTVLPISFSSFTAQSQNKKVALNWTTSMEQNNTGFAVMRKTSTGNHEWEEVGFVRSFGNSNTKQSYSFTDEPKGGDSFLYQLKQIDVDGKSTLSNILKVKLNITELSLSNYPNPFQGQTTIIYSLPKASSVRLVVRNQFGQVVKTVVNVKQTAGNYALTLNTNGLSSGVYYNELITESGKLMNKITLQK